MSRSIKWLSLLMLLLLGCVLSPTQADEAQGGMIVEGVVGDFMSFDPLFESNAITKLLFPDFIGINPNTGLFEKDAPHALVTDWAISEEGTVYTFKLRDNWTWSDGVPITSKDIVYAWDVITSGIVDTGLAYLKLYINKVEAPDATTVRITFEFNHCSALNDASALPVLPSHVLPKDFSALNTSEFNTNPTVTGGIFQFGELKPNDQITLPANLTWAGSTASVLSAGYVYKFEADRTQQLDNFIAGKTDVIINPPAEKYAELRQNPNINTYIFAGNAWDYLALNYADPLHPSDGLDAKGNLLDQGHHPLFGDVRVRQAIARAIDVDALIKDAASGEATRIASSIIPSSWAYDKNLPPVAYNLNESKRLLEDAGWVDDDHDANTPRIARGAKYAADGTPFKFTLYTVEGGTRRDAVASLIRDQLRLLGVEADVQIIDFNRLLKTVYNQEFDAYIGTWRNNYPDNPNQTAMFTVSGDVLRHGSNFTSYANSQIADLNFQAYTLPDCDPAARAKIYGEMQAMMQQDLPYIWLYSLNEMYAAQKTIQGFDPRPNQPYWNIERWTKTQP